MRTPQILSLRMTCSLHMIRSRVHAGSRCSTTYSSLLHSQISRQLAPLGPERRQEWGTPIEKRTGYVPQGSILGPLMFSLYMNDLPSVVKFSSVESYVDDTKIYLSCSSENIDSCIAKVSADLRLIASWCCTNKLLINPDKTKLILFGTKQLLRWPNTVFKCLCLIHHYFKNIYALAPNFCKSQD